MKRFIQAKYLTYIFPIILGFLYAGAEQFIISNGDFTITTPSFLARLFIYSSIFSVVFYLIFTLLSKKHKTNTQANIQNLKFKSILKTWIILILCWLPVYIMLFPGVMIGDTSIQIAQYLNGEGFADWHPFLTTFIFGWFISIFGANQAMVGVGVFIAIQMLLASFTLAFLCNYIGYITKSNKFKIAALILFAFPIAPLSFMNMNKDDIFCIFFIWFCISFCEVWRTRGEILKNKKFIFFFIIFSILACLTKKTGAYIIPCSLFALIFLVTTRRQKIITSVTTVSVVALIHFIIPTFIFPIINVSPGPKSEALAVPIQLVSSAAIAYPEDFSQDDQQIINDTIAVGYNNIKDKYNSYTVDPIKGTGSPNSSSSGAFLKLFIREGIKHPWTYIKAELGLQNGWSTFTTPNGKNNTYSRSTDSYSANTLTEEITWPEASVASKVFASLYASITKIPVVNTIFFVGVWASFVPILILFLIFRHGKNITKSLLAVLPLLLSFVLLYICPVSTHQRYMLPMFYTGVLFIAVLYINYHNSSKKKET